ncbi:MAG: cupin domain-containing protein [Chloroflexi bacterium]|nr:cupin domain-containing protein [Chloroflexota bacterium]
MERATTTQPQAAAIVDPGQGEAFADCDAQVTVKASAESTLGAFTALEYTLAPGKSGPPLHLHRLVYEAFQVLEGELTLRMGGRTVTARPGALAFVPLGVAHAFSNQSGKPVRFLHITSPGGYDSYLRETAKLMAEHGALPPDVAAEIAERYDIEPA